MDSLTPVSNHPGTPAVSVSERRGLRTFWALNGVMFQGALSDNIYKLVLVMLVIKLAQREFAGDAQAATARAGYYQTLVEAAFIVPFMLAVSVAGWLSDRFSKTRVTQGTKVMEFVVMAGATGTFLLGNPWLSVAVLFLMGLQAALFSPSKYGILPEILSESRIAWGNGILQGWTFLAIIVGTIVGPWLYGVCEQQLWIAGVALMALAAIGYVTSRAMDPPPAAAPTQRFYANPYPMIRRYGREILLHTGLKWSMFGMVVWWMVGVMAQSAAILVAQQILGLTPAQTGFALLPIVVGLGLGCMATGMISRKRIELGLVPFGAIAMCVTSLIVWAATPGPGEWAKLSALEMARLKILLPVLMGLVGLVCGFFIVPLQSYFIQSADPEIRGGVWATSNVLTSAGMVLGTIVKAEIVGRTHSPGTVFLVGGLLMLAAGIVVFLRFPMLPLRFFITTLLRLLYRVRITGLENLPASGGALLTSNHQSYLDAVLVASLTERPVRFLMSIEMYRKWCFWPMARLTNSIPISGQQSARDLIRGIRCAREAVRQGQLVAIFPEGQLTRIGMMQPFQRGFLKIMKGVDAPIIPLALDGAYDSAFGLPGGRLRLRFRNPFRRHSINITIGRALAPTTPPAALRRVIVELLADGFALRKTDARPLHRETLRTLRAGTFSSCYADHSTAGRISRAKLLAAIVALGGKLRAKWADQETIGILLPPSIAGVAVNVAATLAGRVTVNLNYTASLPILEEISKQSGLRVVITSRAFLEKANLKLPPGIEIVCLEDLRQSITALDRLAALLRGQFQPAASLERSLGRTRTATIDDIVTLIFSSGSTGIPKGVPLTHWNLWANCTGAWQQIVMPPGARLLGVLPFFHSFGYLVALWLPMMKGFGVVYHPNPLDARVIGRLVERYHVTHFFGTPTFVSVYARRVQPGQFGSLQFVITGAEKLRPATTDAFDRRFGLRLIEGYGCTECSPVVTMSTENFHQRGIFQRGNKPGSIGHPLPGVAVRIVDLDTEQELPPNEPGMMLVRGPNVMSGYFQLPEKTAEVLKNGWYVTGDVARMDEDGFVTITDRLSRFSKIGGEMIPHVKIEEALQQATGLEEQVFAVTGVPDEKKGERIVVLYSILEGQAREAAEMLQKTDLPPLWLPKWTDFIPVEQIPVLGTGKPDLRRIRDIAVAATATPSKGPSAEPPRR